MGGLIPLSDASRRPAHFPIITICIILANAYAFSLELKGGDAFVLQWSAIPANIIAGHRWITVLTSMFLHGSWSHILGNMVFLWAFGPEVEDSMNRLRYLDSYALNRKQEYFNKSQAASSSCRTLRMDASALW